MTLGIGRLLEMLTFFVLKGLSEAKKAKEIQAPNRILLEL